MDKKMIGTTMDVAMSEEDQARMANMFEHLQIRDSLRMYNSLVERCLTDCVDNFSRKTLQKQEEMC